MGWASLAIAQFDPSKIKAEGLDADLPTVLMLGQQHAGGLKNRAAAHDRSWRE